MRSAVAKSRSRTAALIVWPVAQIWATTPDVCGVAIDVPLNNAYCAPPLTSGFTVERMPTPGAATSTSAP
jgi:hypothetical protein